MSKTPARAPKGGLRPVVGRDQMASSMMSYLTASGPPAASDPPLGGTLENASKQAESNAESTLTAAAAEGRLAVEHATSMHEHAGISGVDARAVHPRSCAEESAAGESPAPQSAPIAAVDSDLLAQMETIRRLANIAPNAARDQAFVASYSAKRTEQQAAPIRQVGATELDRGTMCIRHAHLLVCAPPINSAVEYDQ